MTDLRAASPINRSGQTKLRDRVCRMQVALAAFASLLLWALPVSAAEPPEPLEDSRQEIRQLKARLDQEEERNRAITDHLVFAPEVAIEDYSEVRARFRTKLLRRESSPQKASPIKAPDGVTEIDYRSGDLRLRAWMNRPADVNRGHPAVLFLHGGFAFGSGDWDQSKPYRDNGYVVMTPLLRGENGQPGAFSYFYDEVSDALAAAEVLRGLPYVDTNRLFVAGHSAGGTMSLLLAQASVLFRAGVSFDGACYRPEFINGQWNVPYDKRDPREYQVRSPLAYAASFKFPFRMFYSKESAGFFALMSTHTAGIAQRHGLDVEAREVDGDHNSHVSRAITNSILFFHKITTDEALPWAGAISPLPKVVALDLGGNQSLKLVRIEPGRFLMGSPTTEAGRNDDEPQHQVEVAKAFAIGVYTVTQAQYRQVTGVEPSRFSASGGGKRTVAGLNTDDFPVEGVGWEEAMDFCRLLSLRSDLRDNGWVADLPTEVEWEYACRAGTATAFHFGNSLSGAQANFDGEKPYGDAPRMPSLKRTTKVGSYPPNAWGLHDMHGNVLQWCKDVYEKNYQEGADQNLRVARGGFWSWDATKCRAASRLALPRDARPHLGFRVVLRQRGQQQ